MKAHLFSAAVVALLLFASAAQVHGEIAFRTVDSIIHSGEQANQGWWDKVGGLGNNSTNYNIDVREQPLAIYWIRNFFTFDLSTLTDTATAAKLRIPILPGTGVASDTPEEYRLFDVLTDPFDLNFNDGTNTEIWTDLGTGDSYGAIELFGTFSGEFIEIPLNEFALADINAARGNYFSIGGAITTSDGDDWIEFLQPVPVQLLVSTIVPEPSTIGIASFLFLTCAARLWLRRNLATTH